jgi:hypothetical protein
MTLFGSRDEDPLLKNDPLAPSEPKDGDADGATEGTEEKAPASRRVEYSVAEAATGPLRTLNRAFGQGWRLARVDRDGDRLIFTLRRADGPSAGHTSE